MPPKLRPFEESDYPAAFSLWQQTEGLGLSDADSRAGITQFLRRNPGLSLVAVDGAEIVGTILCGHDGRRGLIHHLAVKTAHRRSGLGRRLVRQGLSALQGQGIDKCHLLVIGENASARAFWLRVGAEERTPLVIFSLLTREGGLPDDQADPRADGRLGRS